MNAYLRIRGICSFLVLALVSTATNWLYIPPSHGWFVWLVVLWGLVLTDWSRAKVRDMVLWTAGIWLARRIIIFVYLFINGPYTVTFTSGNYVEYHRLGIDYPGVTGFIFSSAILAYVLWRAYGRQQQLRQPL